MTAPSAKPPIIAAPLSAGGEWGLLSVLPLQSLVCSLTGVTAASDSPAAQVGSPLHPHVFIHQTVEDKNKEAYDGVVKTCEDESTIIHPFTQQPDKPYPEDCCRW